MFISEKRQLLIALQRALLLKITLIGHLLTSADVIFQHLMNKLETGI